MDGLKLEKDKQERISLQLEKDEQERGKSKAGTRNIKRKEQALKRAEKHKRHTYGNENPTKDSQTTIDEVAVKALSWNIKMANKDLRLEKTT